MLRYFFPSFFVSFVWVSFQLFLSSLKFRCLFVVCFLSYFFWVIFSCVLFSAHNYRSYSSSSSSSSSVVSNGRWYFSLIKNITGYDFSLFAVRQHFMSLSALFPVYLFHLDNWNRYFVCLFKSWPLFILNVSWYLFFERRSSIVGHFLIVW